MSTEAAPLERPRSPGELFAAFTLPALHGFGGVLAVAQRVLCEPRRWLTREQFVKILAIGQILPGPNVCNVALMVAAALLVRRPRIHPLWLIAAGAAAAALGWVWVRQARGNSLTSAARLSIRSASVWRSSSAM